ncbi:MAG TPA: STY0301 family protein [Burkholderiales bacterium]|nr:STY0301 family protein [Burkholderiales bacterium]
MHRPALLPRLLATALLTVPALTADAAQRPPPEPLGENLCPATINVEQRIAPVPEGWEASLSADKPQLAMVTFFDGPPAERASLKYDSEEKQRSNWVATWTLAPSARGYWIQCAYENTTALLARRLPESVRTCKVIYERKTSGTSGLPAVKHVGCSDKVPKKADEKK